MSRVSMKHIGRSVAVSVMAFAVALSPLGGVELAHAATKTWTGAGVDNKFSTAANWSDNSVPVDGDILAITAGPSEYTTLIDDVETRFGGVQISGESDGGGYALEGDLNLQDGAVYSLTATYSFFVGINDGIDTGRFVSDGALVIENGYIPGTTTVNGVITAKSGVWLRVGDFLGATGYIIENDASLNVSGVNSITVPITLGGGSGSKPNIDTFAGMGAGGGGAAPAPVTYTLSSVTLLSDAEVYVSDIDTVKITNLVKNGHTITRANGINGTLITPDGTQSTTYVKKTTTLSGKKDDESVTVDPKETAILKGSRASVYVKDGGVLKGEGTVGYLTANSGAVVAPGNSPGTITILEMLSLGSGSTYEAEIFDKSSYDKLVAKQEAHINDAKLSVSFLPGGKVTKGDTFTIIDNQGDDPTNGTFAGLAEGAKITVGKAVFAISYEGGDGNDVVLTALTTATAPGAPNTGFQAVLANPMLAATIGLVAAGALAIAARRFAHNK